MAIEYPGNAIPAPGIFRGGQTVDDELLYSTEGGFTQKGVTLEPGQGVLPLGTILARKTSTKRYVKYVSGGADGAGTPRGFLRMTTNTGVAGETSVFQGNIVIVGLLKLAAVKYANSGVTLTGILGGREDDVQGFFKF